MWMDETRWGILFILYGRETPTKKEHILRSMQDAGYSGDPLLNDALQDLSSGGVNLIERTDKKGYYSITDKGREAVVRFPFRLFSRYNSSE